MILAIGTLLFNIVSALIQVPMEYSLRIGVLVPEADALVAPLPGRIRGVEGASLFESESESEGILYHSSSSSSSSSSELLAKESSDSDSSSDSPKLGKSNKRLSKVKNKVEVLCFF
jgi:hypothetical protein